MWSETKHWDELQEMRQKQYSQWDSDFFDSVFANPAPDPLQDLQEVSFRLFLNLQHHFAGRYKNFIELG